MRKSYKKIISLLLVMAILLTIIGPNIAAFFTNKDIKSDSYTIGQIEVEVVGEDNLYSAEKLTPNYEYNFTRAVKNIGINDAYVYMAVTIPYDLIYTHDLDGNQVEGTENDLTETQLFTYGTNHISGVNSEWKLVDVGNFDDYDIEEIGDTIKNKSDTHGAIRTNRTVTYVYGWVGSNGNTLSRLAPDATTASLFDTMKFVNASDTDLSFNIEETFGQILTQVYAIQCDNVFEEEYMTGNNMDGSEGINSVWSVINNALVRTNDEIFSQFVAYVGEEHIVRPSINAYENQYGESLTMVNVISDTELYEELVNSGDYYDISKNQNMDVVAGVIPNAPASTMSLRARDLPSEYTYVIVAKDNTIVMAPEDISNWFAFLRFIQNIMLENVDFRETVNMSGMFQGSVNLEQVIFPSYNDDGEKVEYSNVSNITNMFSGCTNLVDTNVNVFTGVTEAEGVFDNCSSLEQVDLSWWNYIDISWLQWLIENSATIREIVVSQQVEQQMKNDATEEQREKLEDIVEVEGKEEEEIDETIIPVGGTYYVNVPNNTIGDFTGAAEVLVGDGQTVRFPDTVGSGDAYVYGDYEYRYKKETKNVTTWTTNYDSKNIGWGVRCVNDVAEPGIILESINNVNVVSIHGTFFRCYNVVKSPAIPQTIVDMSNAFNYASALSDVSNIVIPKGATDLLFCFSGCTSLVDASTLSFAEGATNMYGLFNGAENLVKAPVIPDTMVDMGMAFDYCTSLTSISPIPASVKDMSMTFFNCKSLTGTIVINANPDDYSKCFYGVDFDKQNLIVTGDSEILGSIMGIPELCIHAHTEIEQNWDGDMTHSTICEDCNTTLSTEVCVNNDGDRYCDVCDGTYCESHIDEDGDDCCDNCWAYIW